MPTPIPLKIRAAFALGIAAALSGPAWAEAGKAEFVLGSATVSNAQGSRPLVRGADLESGDTVRTTDGRVQIRFKDGAYVSLQPNTEFAIKQYQFDGKTDGTERGVFGLLKGTMRTVTGLIGRVNKKAYEIDTPTATVGIRGTGGIIAVGPDGATRIIGTTGVWILANAAGFIEIPAGRSGFAPTDQSRPPQQTGEAPQAPPAPVVTIVQVPVSKAEERSSTGGSVAVLNTAQPTGVVFAEVAGGSQKISISQVSDSSFSSGNSSFSVKGNVGPSGELSGFTFTQQSGGTTAGFDFKFSGTLLDGGSDGPISWGRWTGPVTVTFTQNGVSQSASASLYPANGGFSYVLGNPATQMPTAGSFTYNMIGATAPTVNDSSFAPGSVTSAQLIGTFTPTGGSVSMNMGFNANSQNFTMSASGSISGIGFSGSGSVNGAACSASCSASIQGGFFGVGATHAGVAYTADVIPGGAQQVGGIVALRR